ncbi:MAG: mechanosensitive ion channel family protein [Blastochloris sp.]|nr:mechanosensitive ion channel family protein [Blastochloris sp.]
MNLKWQELMEFLRNQTGGQEGVTFLCLVGAGFLAAFFVRLLVRRFVVGRSKESKKTLIPVDEIAGILNYLLPALVFLYFLNIALDVFKNMPAWLWTWKNSLIPALYLIMIVVMGWKLIDVVVKTVFGRLFASGEEIDDHLCLTLGRLFKVLFLGIVGIFLLDNFGVKVLPLITGLSFLGAAVALAAQNTIGNIIGGLEILADRLFRQGDRISFAEYDGFVIKRGLRSVALQSIHGEVINIPNKDLVDKQIRNFSRERDAQGRPNRQHRIKFELGLVYETTADEMKKARDLLYSICQELEPAGNAQVVFRRLGSFSLDLEAYVWTRYRNEEELNDLLNRANFMIKERFDAAGLSFAFPTQTVHLSRE